MWHTTHNFNDGYERNVSQHTVRGTLLSMGILQDSFRGLVESMTPEDQQHIRQVVIMFWLIVFHINVL